MKIELTEKALEQLTKLPVEVRSRLTYKLAFYAQQEDPLHFAKRLSGSELYRFRIGDYRAIFEVMGEIMYVLLIVKRDKAYRDL